MGLAHNTDGFDADLTDGLDAEGTDEADDR